MHSVNNSTNHHVIMTAELVIKQTWHGIHNYVT